MQRFLFLTAVFSAVLLAGVAASGQELPPPAPGDAASEAPAIPRSDSAATPAPAGEKWRFKWHSGRWWYWLPSERWVYWHQDHWEDYLPPPPAPVAESAPTVVYRYPATSYYYPSRGYYGGGYYGSGHLGYGGGYWGGHHHHYVTPHIDIGFGHFGGHYGGHYGGHHHGGHHGGGHHGGHHHH